MLDQLTVVVPTFNEAGNVAALVRQVHAATADIATEILFVDDSTDETPEVIAALAAAAPEQVRVIHRTAPAGGLSGAVLEGIRAAANDLIVVMDGDLQHPPAMVPVLARAALAKDADLVVASRYCEDGEATGLANSARRAVSSVSTLLTRSMFPAKLRDCTDPMTGFFALQRSHLDFDQLQPRGFKVLLEIIVRQPRRPVIAEEPFVFGERLTGHSKATMAQGLRFLRQLLALRFGRMSAFALVGALGAVLNIGLVALMTSLGVEYLIAAAVAAELTIVGNFVLLERFVFRDLAGSQHRTGRLIKSLLFNNIEAAIRLPLLYVLVDLWTIASVPATAITLALAFLARFVFHARVVYGPRSALQQPQTLSEADVELLGAPAADVKAPPSELRG